MKRIKSFEFRCDYGNVKEQCTNEINDLIKGLNDNGIKDVDINLTSTGKGVMYSLIWDEHIN